MEELAIQLNFIKNLAEKYDLQIDWEASDVFSKKLSFLGGSDEQIVAFCMDIENYFNSNKGE